LWKYVDKKHYVDAILIQCYSGWRPQELCRLEVGNIDLENWVFKGGMKTESGTDRIVPIHSTIRNLVERKYKEAVSKGDIFLFGGLTYRVYKDGFYRIVTELGLNPNHRPHDGRTHFVTFAKKYGVDEYAIKYIVGHKVSDITEKVYTKREFE